MHCIWLWNGVVLIFVGFYQIENVFDLFTVNSVVIKFKERLHILLQF
ncbi:MAG: hypothetical protein ACXW4M_14565 [Anaerolineales bacterium]